MTHPAVRAEGTTTDTEPASVWGADGRPMVTVVIIMFNDIANVGTAIRSALDQTLKGTEVIVVDDCSTDGSFEYVSEMAKSEPRLRAFQTPKNSGGPGAPRNIGMDNASAPYLTFLDSDDILERHATYNLLTAAERSDADIVMAKTRRREIAKKKFRGWHHRLYREEQHFDTIEDNPELCIDTIAVAKLYRLAFLRDNGIRFREELHYEDLIFTAEVFAKADGIRVIPEFVYQWNLYPIKVRKSITNQRDDIKNLQHRKVALAEVLRVADRSVVPLLHDRLQLKILRHDARLYLNDIAAGQVPNLAPELLAELRPLIESIPIEIYQDVPRDDRLLIAAALSGDVDLVTRMAKIAAGTWDLYGDWEPGESTVSGSRRPSLTTRSARVSACSPPSTPLRSPRFPGTRSSSSPRSTPCRSTDRTECASAVRSPIHSADSTNLTSKRGCSSESVGDSNGNGPRQWPGSAQWTA